MNLWGKVKKLWNNKGFTLVELLIVVAIIGILAGIIAPNISNVGKVDGGKLIANSASVQGAVNTYTLTSFTRGVPAILEHDYDGSGEKDGTWKFTSELDGYRVMNYVIAEMFTTVTHDDVNKVTNINNSDGYSYKTVGESHAEITKNIDGKDEIVITSVPTSSIGSKLNYDVTDDRRKLSSIYNLTKSLNGELVKGNITGIIDLNEYLVIVSKTELANYHDKEDNWDKTIWGSREEFNKAYDKYNDEMAGQVLTRQTLVNDGKRFNSKFSFYEVKVE